MRNAVVCSVIAIDTAAVQPALLCGEVAAPRARPRPPRSRGGIHELTAEAFAELLGVGAIGKAEDDRVLIVAPV